jgi:hypothetical protein
MIMPLALEKWYADRCDGDWEHQWGIEIGTIDNPGWTLKIDLMKTTKQDAVLQTTRIERSERDWIMYWVAENRFQAACGPENLSEVIALFIAWFESN